MADYLSTQPYKGTRDFYPEDMIFRNWMFDRVRDAVQSHGFEEYMGPMLEPLELYAAKTGEEIVKNQLYSMVDRGERQIAVRPEMTPTLARMVAAKFHELPKPIRWFSIPNLWRYERPQKGRLREHWQLNVDILGGDTMAADLEILLVAKNLMEKFGAEIGYEIRVNHRGVLDTFFKQELKISGEVQSKVIKAIDAKDKLKPEEFQKWILDAGVDETGFQKIREFFEADLSHIGVKYPSEAQKHLTQLFSKSAALFPVGVLRFDSSIMRGMDYYTGMVFEIYDLDPENRRAMFGGGRYDNLIGLFGKNTYSGVGFGMGDVTLENFLRHHKKVPELKPCFDAYVGYTDSVYFDPAFRLSQVLRHSGKKVLQGLSQQGFSALLKSASQSGAKKAYFFGEKEWAEGKILVKDLESQTQSTEAWSDLV